MMLQLTQDGKMVRQPSVYVLGPTRGQTKPPEPMPKLDVDPADTLEFMHWADGEWNVVRLFRDLRFENELEKANAQRKSCVRI